MTCGCLNLEMGRTDQAERVLRSPLAVSSPPDVVVWRYEGFKEYFVNSGYKAFFRRSYIV
ncbi:hypothetical protein EPI10_031782 [Gossypium australe]|uniref:Uncharacterized protein n=1 Tax=Gossypium australe TaxID=47621 RepID=A0A5B6X2J1_9ROSI|nr:hypothetical protein EPI10_031782 [Gossypium australe]